MSTALAVLDPVTSPPVRGWDAAAWHRTAAELAERFESFVRHTVARGAPSADTRAGYRKAATYLLAWCGQEHRHPVTLTRADVLLWRADMQGRDGLGAATIAQRLVVARCLLGMLVEMGARPDNPATGVTAAHDVARDRAPRSLTLTELHDALRGCPDTLTGRRALLVLHLMGYHGLRSVEVHRALLADVDEDPGVGFVLLVRGKGKHREVFLRPDTVEVLTRYRDALRAAGLDSPALVPAHTGTARALSRCSLRALVTRLLRRSGCTRFSGCHVLRHTAATLSLRAGASVEQVRDLLGHSSVSITNLYAHAIERRLHNPALLIPAPGAAA